MSDAKVSINLHDGIFEIEGGESFVEQQMVRFESLINTAFSTDRKNEPAKDVIVDQNNKLPPDTKEGSNSLDDLNDIYEIHNDKLHIIKDIPGSNVKAQTLAAALLVCFGKTKEGSDNALLDDVRSECERHACYNSKKFATYVKSYNTLFLESGSGKASTIKLTVPGKNLAQDLISRLRSGDIGDFFSAIKSKPAPKSATKRSATTDTKKGASGSSKPGPGAIIDSLIEEGFFNDKKGPTDVVEHCKHSKVLSYNNNEIMVSLSRAVKSNKLKREKNDDGQYGYSKP